MNLKLDTEEKKELYGEDWLPYTNKEGKLCFQYIIIGCSIKNEKIQKYLDFFYKVEKANIHNKKVYLDFSRDVCDYSYLDGTGGTLHNVEIYFYPILSK